MTVFHCDLDNTLVYSYKKDIGAEKILVEVYEGREITFMTKKTQNLLKTLPDSVLFVPSTTRTVAQFQRLDLGQEFPYALVANGSILLKNGEIDGVWYEESLKLRQPYEESLKVAEAYLTEDPHRSTEIRWVDQFFFYCKSDKPQETAEDLTKKMAGTGIFVCANGSKVYAMAEVLEKGEAVKRFRRLLPREKDVAAGDSVMDVSMLRAVDCAYAPQELGCDFCIFPDDGVVFSEFLLEEVAKK